MKRFLSCIFALVTLTAIVFAAETPQRAVLQAKDIEDLFSSSSDLTTFKLKVDALVDQEIDPILVKRELDELYTKLVAKAATARTSHEKLKSLKTFLYESGDWNDNRPFSYDLSNPRGDKPKDKLLATYLKSRKGNCVTMPILMAILGQRLGLNMTLALAPFHVFIKMKDEQGNEWNIEATSGGGYTRDLWYRQELPMSDLAVSKGTYLRALTAEESMSVIASLLIEKAIAEKQPETASLLANAVLKHFPKFTNALLYRGSASTMILRDRLMPMFPDVETMPPEIRSYAESLYAQNQQDFAAAEALGWTEKDGIKP